VKDLLHRITDSQVKNRCFEFAVNGIKEAEKAFLVSELIDQITDTHLTNTHCKLAIEIAAQLEQWEFVKMLAPIVVNSEVKLEILKVVLAPAAKCRESAVVTSLLTPVNHEFMHSKVKLNLEHL
jgi:hypothetical protein